MLEDRAEQAAAVAEANDHELVYRFVKRLAPPKKGAEVALRRPRSWVQRLACLVWDNTAQRQAASQAPCDILRASEVAVVGGSVAGICEISAELVEKQIRKLPNNKGGPNMKILEKSQRAMVCTQERWQSAGSLCRMKSRVGCRIASKILFDNRLVPDELTSREIFRLQKQGKAFTRITKELFEQKLLETTSRVQFGAKRGRSTCHAAAIVSESCAK